MTPKEKIISYLKEFGASRADNVARYLGVTAMAVRQHLYLLRDEGLVEETSVAQGRGRPAKHWSLTPRADVYFPDAHRDLSVGLIQSVRAALGDSAMETLLDHRLNSQIAEYGAALDGITETTARLNVIAELRTHEGYMAHVIEDGDDWLLAEAHCPVCAAAEACTGLCAKELNLFEHLMGDALTVTRESHILKGAERCLYRISPNKA